MNPSKSLKAQASLEFLMIIGIAMTILIPILLIANNYKAEASDVKTTIAIKNALKEIEEKSIAAYNQGTGAVLTANVYFPSNIQSINIEANSYLTLRAEKSYGIEDYYIKLPFNLTISRPYEGGGRYLIKITSQPYGVDYEFIKQ